MTSNTVPLHFFSYDMSLSLLLFPWRWSSVEFFPTKVRLVAWRCSPRRDLDAVRGERERKLRGRKGRWAERARASERLCHYFTVITQRLNSTAASSGVCRELAFVYKEAEITSSFSGEKSGSERVWYSAMYRGWNWIVGRGHDRENKKGKIRKSPKGREQIVSSAQ